MGYTQDSLGLLVHPDHNHLRVGLRGREERVGSAALETREDARGETHGCESGDDRGHRGRDRDAAKNPSSHAATSLIAGPPAGRRRGRRRCGWAGAGWSGSSSIVPVWQLENACDGVVRNARLVSPDRERAALERCGGRWRTGPTQLVGAVFGFMTSPAVGSGQRKRRASGGGDSILDW